MNQQFCFVKDQNGGFAKIYFEDILFIKSLGNYLQFVTTKGTFVALGTLAALETELGDLGFFARVHKSYIVNLVRIDHLSSDGILLGGQSLPVGAKYMESIKRDFVFNNLLKL